MTSLNDSIEDPSSQPPPEPAASELEAQRRHDLDALRAFAMLLGIGLHAAIPFVSWRAEDDPANALLDAFLAFVHGFRVPLFFLISGFFTAMLWRRRGLGSLMRHRLRRIGLPLLISLVTILPAVWVGFAAMLVISGEEALSDLVADEAVGGYERQLDETIDSAESSERSRARSDPAATESLIDGESALDASTEDGRAADVEPSQGAEFALAHLWFLWVLLWQVAAFALIATAVQRLSRRTAPRPAGTSRGATWVMWLLPALTLVPQLAMTPGSFGPDTSDTLLPAPHVLVYYACFFGFGALMYGRSARGSEQLIDVIGARWVFHLLLAVVVLFPLGLGLAAPAWVMSSVLQVGFAWTMSLGLIGLFRRAMSKTSFRVRFMSDASYWMYLAHLPLIFPMQGLMARFELTAVSEFVLVCAAVTLVSLVTYRYLVRYTLIGAVLNGRRTRQADRDSRAAQARKPSSKG